jgi:dTDP-4-dehydrorhamnose reductase
MRAIRSVIPHARLIQTEDCGRTFGTPATAAQVAFDNDRRWLTFDLLCGRVDRTHPMWGFLTGAGAAESELDALLESPCPPDVIGLNYYLTSDRFLDEAVERYPEWTRGGNYEMAYADVEAVRARPEGIHGHAAHLRDAWARYQRPLAVTEVHVDCTPDEQIRWLVEAWRGAQAAAAAGADVRAVTAWALFGAMDWDSLLTRDAGHYEAGAFDTRHAPPRPTPLAAAIAALAASRSGEHLAPAGAPWWRRDERLLYRPGSDLDCGYRAGVPKIKI